MARLVGHAGCVSSVEWLDEVGRGFGVVRLFCGVGDADGDVLLVVVDGAGDGAVVGVVDDGVAYQVVHSEREVARVRLDEGAVVCGESVGVDAQVTCLCLFAVGFERVAYDAGGVHGFRAGVGHGLDAGEFEQTVDEFTAFAVRFDGVADGWFDVLGEPVWAMSASRLVPMVVIGVFSSWLALRMNDRCSSLDCSMRSSIVLSASARPAVSASG